jgi:hemoglobin
MRHVPFPIGQAERNAWLSHMRAAVNSSDAAPADAEALLDYFDSASTSLINRPA